MFALDNAAEKDYRLLIRKKGSSYRPRGIVLSALLSEDAQEGGTGTRSTKRKGPIVRTERSDSKLAASGGGRKALFWAVGALVAVALVTVACGRAQEPAPAAAPADAPAAVAPKPAGEAEKPKAEAEKPKPAVKAMDDGKPKTGGILTLAHRRDPPAAFDTMRTGTISLGHVSASVTGSGNLLKPCPDDVSTICLGRAEKWEANSDSSEFTFKVRDDILWHDGQKFTAEDVKFWFDLAFFGAEGGDKKRAPARWKGSMGDIKQVDVLDGNRVRITLNGPDGIWPARLGQLQAGVTGGAFFHPKHLMEPLIKKGQVSVSPLEVGLVGTGAFKLLEYKKGSVFRVRRFDKYFEKDKGGNALPYLDGVDFPIITDPTAMDAAFRTGRLDGTARGSGFYLSKERHASIQKALGDKVWFGAIEGWRAGFRYNLTEDRPGPWQDVRVRKAILLWVDKEQQNEAVMGGPPFGFVHPFVSPNSQWVDPDWMTKYPGFNPKTRDKDKAEAKSLMKEAGFENGFEMGMFCRRQWTFACEPVVGELKDLGVTVKLVLGDDVAWQERTYDGKYDAFFGGAFGFDPGIGPEALEVNMQPRSVNPRATNRHEDPKIAPYFERFKKAGSNMEERIKIWREMEAYLWSQAWAVPTFGENAVTAYRSHVKGLPIPSYNRSNNMDLATTWLDR